MVEGMKAVSEENTKMTKRLAELTEKMESSTKQNAEATLRMSQLAESSNRQAEQSARQAKSMAALTYDAKARHRNHEDNYRSHNDFSPTNIRVGMSRTVLLITSSTSSRQSSVWVSFISTLITPTAELKYPGISGSTWRLRSHSRLRCLDCRMRGCDGLVRRRRSRMTTSPRKHSLTPPIQCVSVQDLRRRQFDENNSIASRW
jgi:hypothetical protein